MVMLWSLIHQNVVDLKKFHQHILCPMFFHNKQQKHSHYTPLVYVLYILNTAEKYL